MTRPSHQVPNDYKIKVFVSSTTADLGNYRAEVVKALNSRNNIEAIVGNRDGADAIEIKKKLRGQIIDCDAMICIVGFLYGEEPRRSNEKRSYTQIEFDIAKRFNKPIYVYLASESCRFDSFTRENPEKERLQKAFREEVRKLDKPCPEFADLPKLINWVSNAEFDSPWIPPPIPRKPVWLRTLQVATLMGLLGLVCFLGYSFRERANEVSDFLQRHTHTLVKGTNQIESLVSTNYAKETEKPPSSLVAEISVPNAFQHEFVKVSIKGMANGLPLPPEQKTPGPVGIRPEFLTFTNLVAGEYEILAQLVHRGPPNPSDGGEVTVSRRVVVPENTKVRQRLSIQGVRVQFKVDPPEATVYALDGRRQPAQMKAYRGNDVAYLPPGLRTFSFESRGYENIITNIFVDADTDNDSQPVPIELKLPRRYYPEPETDWEVTGMDLELAWIGGVWIGKTEVTRKQFAAFVGDTQRIMPNQIKCLTTNGWSIASYSWNTPPFEQTEAHPVVGVSWEDAVAFCEWLTRTNRDARLLSTSHAFRLPTVNEYRTVSKNYRWDPQRDPNRGNLAGPEVAASTWPWPINFSTVRNRKSDMWPRTAPAGSTADHFRSSDLVDLLGNVAEWSWDWYTRDVNADDVRNEDTDYFNEDGNGTTYKAVFGASWADHDDLDIDLRVVHKAYPSERTDRIGFRVALEDNGER